MPSAAIRRSTRRTQPALTALSAALLLVTTLSACGTADSSESTPLSTPQSSPQPKAAPAVQRVVAGQALTVRTSPLTGVPTRPGTLARPVLTVKIENSVDARPQAGL